MKSSTQRYSNTKQAVLPILIREYLDICDPVLTFDRFMEEIDLEKYLKDIPEHYTGRIRYNPVSMLKTVLFGFIIPLQSVVKRQTRTEKFESIKN